MAINGAGAPLDALDRLPPAHPDADVIIGRLPGAHTPQLSDMTVAGFAAAYTEVIDSFCRPMIHFGPSVGALVVFATRTPLLRALVATEPPLRTGGPPERKVFGSRLIERAARVLQPAALEFVPVGVRCILTIDMIGPQLARETPQAETA